MSLPARLPDAGGPRVRLAAFSVGLLAALQLPLRAQLAPPSAGGALQLDRLLHQLSETRRLLVVGAHPDDEDTEVLALAALRHGAEAAYLSLSRGEGGQNLIGPELGVGLGLLRTQELLAARTTDGATQFFTRAFDFGFSRSLEETSRWWPRDSVLKDAVRVLRRFRPHVVVSVFTGTPRDGHGQHQMAGVVAREAFAAAGDPGRFPELAREGLEPWQPLRLYRSTRFDSSGTTLEVQVGTLDLPTGRTFHQVAMASRSLHRSQDMGQLQRLGPEVARLQLMEAAQPHAPDERRADDLFQGIPREDSWVTALADSLRREISPARLRLAAAPLADALRRARAEGRSPRVMTLLERALTTAAGVALDARADQAAVVPGQDFTVSVEAFNGGAAAVTLRSVTVSARW
ncbi:MAG TPA: PIG-L family deacetylase, partial [Gemmatimonadales bacterium]|nr:PIG-L family deacetylase [Gemmatimonadales bacterium]